MVSSLLRVPHDPARVVQDKDTPLMYAAQNESKCSLELMEVLLGAGAEVNAASDVSAIGGH